MLTRRTIVRSGVALPFASSWFARFAMGAHDFANIDCGVASGSPRSDGFVIWTRLPSALHSNSPIDVRYEIATTPTFGAIDIVQSGTVTARANRDFTVHYRAEDLWPQTTYYYRFAVEGDFTSQVGRAKTAPAIDSAPKSLNIGVVCCQRYSEGYYGALAHLCNEPVDFVIHLGDHIYSSDKGRVRRVNEALAAEATTLDEYRRKYRLYLSDPHYREARRLFTWIDLWDDHEVFNDYAGARDRQVYRQRFADAYQAYAEYMPITAQIFDGPDGSPQLSVEDRIVFGRLAELVIMDERQFRTPSPCSRLYLTPRCAGAEAQNHSMLGRAQKEFVLNALEASEARCKLLLSEVVMAPVRLSTSGRTFISLDSWDGFPAERESLLAHIDNRAIANVVVLSGDIHAAADARLYRKGATGGIRPTAVEIVTTSISSATLGDYLKPTLGNVATAVISRANPHLDWVDANSHGYSVVTITNDGLRCRHMAVADVTRPTTSIRTAHELRLPLA